MSPHRLAVRRAAQRIAIALGALAAGALLAAPLAAAASSRTVDVLAATYSPASFSVPAGSTIVFKNTSQFPHTATADNGSFDTGLISPGSSKSIVVKKAGKVAFHCQFHGGAGGVGQSGTISVTAVAAAATPRPAKSTGQPTVISPPASDSSSELAALTDGLPWVLLAAAGAVAVALAVTVDAVRNRPGRQGS